MFIGFSDRDNQIIADANGIVILGGIAARYLSKSKATPATVSLNILRVAFLGNLLLLSFTG